MPAYLVADVRVVDSAGFEEYRQNSPAMIAAHGGRYLARGGELTLLEGSWAPQRVTLIEFPSMAALKAWWSSPQYQRLRAVRERTAVSSFVATEGL